MLASAVAETVPAETVNESRSWGGGGLWLAINMTEAEAMELQRNMMMSHLDCSSAIGTWTKCNTVYTTNWNLTIDEVVGRWEPMVKSQQQ